MSFIYYISSTDIQQFFYNINYTFQGTPYSWDLNSGPLMLTTPGEYTLTINNPITVNLKLWGAAGGNFMNTATTAGTGNVGGAGGFAGGTLTMDSPTYIIWVGEGGKHYQESSNTFGNGGRVMAKAFNYYTTAGGGGLSGIFRSSVSQPNAMIIAGGGGGGAGSVGGGTSQAGAAAGYAAGGGGATVSSPGIAGSGSSYGAGIAGSALTGANTATSGYLGGGGGAGYYGGGSGGNNNTVGAGGGGGSSYCSASVVSPSIINSNYSTPGNSSDPQRGTAGSIGATGNVTLATACGYSGAVIISK